MIDKAYLTQNDRLPRLRKTITDQNGPLDLSAGVTNVVFSMAPIDGGSPTVDKQACTIIQSGQTNVGVVEYAWGANDLATPGRYLAEFQVNYTGSLPASTPSRWPMVIYVRKQVA